MEEEKSEAELREELSILEGQIDSYKKQIYYYQEKIRYLRYRKSDIEYRLLYNTEEVIV